MISRLKEYEICSTCGYGHHQEDDGFGYLDCINYYRNHLEPKEIKEARESKVEIWDKVNKVWARKCKDDLVVQKSNSI